MQLTRIMCFFLASVFFSPQLFAAGDLKSSVLGALDQGNWLLSLALVTLAGLGTALTPCVYPLIPITLGIFGAKNTTPVKGFLLASAYVAGMVVLYATLGTAFAYFGVVAGAAFQSPFVMGFVAVFCIIMALSMFGAFEIALPGNLQTKLSQVGGAGFKGAFMMGLVAGIIAAPCTGPVLSVILTVIAQDGDIAKGAVHMIFYGLGIGIPFLILGTFSSGIMKMPKSGPWMETVKSIFGVAMLVAGVYYLQFAVSPISAFIKWLAMSPIWMFVGLSIIGVAIGALHLSFKYVSTTEKLRKGFGVALLSIGLMGIMGSLLNEPAGATHTDAHEGWLTFGKEEGAAGQFNKVLTRAKDQGQPVMVDFFADWCVACKELDKYTYVDTSVQKELERFQAIKIDATGESTDLTKLQKEYRVVGLPTVLFFDSTGRLLKDKTVTGFIEAPEMLQILKAVP